MAKQFSNRDVARVLREMAVFYEMDGVPWKPAAYEKAALSIESLDAEVRELYKEGGAKALDDIAGVGKGIARHVEELLEKGGFGEYDRLKKKMPVDVEELTSVEGVGAHTVKTLWKELKVKNLEDLEKAARAGEIRTLPGFGEKSEEKILQGIEFVKQSSGRRALGLVLPEIRNIETMIRKFPEADEVAVAGSGRRMKETVGDIDILVASKKPEKVTERFLALPFIAHVYGSGPTKTNVRLENRLDADLRVVEPRSWGAALNYFTGSKEHNIALRELAIKKGWKLNEYGLFQKKQGAPKTASPTGLARNKKQKEVMIAGETEEGLYKALGLRYIEPELREMTGEIEAASKNKLPKLIGYGDLKGDLQVQTNWTDGKHSIEKMAEEAQERGLEYIAITDHTKSLAMTGGADEAKLLRQMKEIGAINQKLKKEKKKFRVLTGAEVNIMKDGTLDIADDVLAKLDVVGAAVHSYFNISSSEQTKRIIAACENQNVDIIFHLTARILNRRKPIELDVEEVIKAAKRTGTVLEIDAYPDRLDIKDEYVRRCVKAGMKMCIDSDAHAVAHFNVLEFGIAQARRGWAEKKDIVNAWPVEKMLGFLKKRRD